MHQNPSNRYPFNNRPLRRDTDRHRKQTTPPFDWFGATPTLYLDGEDSQTTYCGCCLTLLFIGLIGIAVYHYFWMYYTGASAIFSQTELATQEYSELNLGQDFFFVSIVYRFRDKLVNKEEIEDIFINLKAYAVKFHYGEEGGDPEKSREALQFTNCKEMSNEYKEEDFVGNLQALSKFAQCLRIPKDFELKGAVGSEEFSYIEIEVLPCDIKHPKCQTAGAKKGSTIHTSKQLEKAYKFSRQFELSLSFTDFKVNVQSYHNPLVKTINSDNVIKIDLTRQKKRDYYFKNISVVSETGFLWETETSESSVAYNKAYSDSFMRDPTLKIKFKGPNGKEERYAPYVVYRLLASNTVTNVHREYELLLDVFGNVGGMSEILTILFIFMVTFHRDVRLEQNLLNSGLLNTELTSEEDQSRLIFSSQSRIFRERKYRQRYGYWEVFRFKYLGWFYECCLPSYDEQQNRLTQPTQFGQLQNRYKNLEEEEEAPRVERFGEYQRDIGLLEERLDYKKLIRSTGQMDVLSNTIFEDYQAALLPHLKVKSDEITERVKKMTHKQAYDQLYNETLQKTELQRRIDAFIRNNLDEKFKDDMEYLREEAEDGEQMTTSELVWGNQSGEPVDRRAAKGNPLSVNIQRRSGYRTGMEMTATAARNLSEYAEPGIRKSQFNLAYNNF